MPELSPILVTPPGVKPISLAEAKAHCHVDHADEDPLIDKLIDASTAHLDGWRGILGRCIVNQTWKLNLEGFCDDEILLPLGDHVSITSVKYRDSANTQQTLSTAYYSGFQSERGPVVVLNTGYSWPTTYDREDAVEITWVAGFGATAASVPAAIRHAQLMLIAHWYDNRSAVAIGDPAMPMPLAVEALLAPYRMNPL